MSELRNVFSTTKGPLRLLWPDVKRWARDDLCGGPAMNNPLRPPPGLNNYDRSVRANHALTFGGLDFNDPVESPLDGGRVTGCGR